MTVTQGKKKCLQTILSFSQWRGNEGKRATAGSARENKRRPATRLMCDFIKSALHAVVVAISATRGNAESESSLIRLISSPGIV